AGNSWRAGRIKRWYSRWGRHAASDGALRTSGRHLRRRGVRASGAMQQNAIMRETSAGIPKFRWMTPVAAITHRRGRGDCPTGPHDHRCQQARVRKRGLPTRIERRPDRHAANTEEPSLNKIYRKVWSRAPPRIVV